MRARVLLVFALIIAAHCAVVVRADPEESEGSEAEVTEEPAVVVDPEFSPSQREQISAKQETHEFRAEVSRLMEIIIHSLYKDREIFMREIISNAADALDKIRFLSLTDKAQLGTGAAAELDIRIKFDKEAKTITLTDRGIGMTKDGLIKHLGVVANSGTTEFLEKLASGGDSLSLIGQFGVGFYSVYLVANKVTVASKNNDDPVQHIWESEAEGTFTVSDDPRGNTLERGTSVTLHLKDDAAEFLAEQKLEGLVTKYSQFINFPIYLWTSKEVEREVPDDSAVEEDEEKVEDLDSDKDGEDTEGEKPKEVKTKKIKEQVNEWKRLNTAKAIWTRSASDITSEEYDEFYKNLAKDTESPLTHIHFAAEGEIAFKSILYIPAKAESGLYDKYYEKSTALKLYVRRVLISDEFDDFLPRYLNFVRGVVDSEDLPLNVSRETLAQSKVLRVMAKKLTRKVLEMLTRLASGKEESEEGEEEEKAEESKDAEKKGEENEKYLKFWEAFGKSIKLGVIDDRANKAKLSKLLRYQTSKSEGKFISLQTYVDRMAENQKLIYYVTGEDLASVEQSPFLERLKKRDLEVIYMTDPLDEYVTTALTDFDGNNLQSVQKEGLKLPGEKSSDSSRVKEVKEEFKDFSKWLEGVYGDKVEKVVISNRIADSPCVLVTGQYGWSANMERIMKAQTFSDASKQQYMYSKKTMEINPRHPIIKEMKLRTAGADTKDPALTDLANLMYDAALLQSGFSMAKPSEFASRIHRVMSLGLDVDPLAKVDEEEPETEEEEPAAEADAAPAEDDSANVDELRDEL